jgi:hypothetical protein
MRRILLALLALVALTGCDPVNTGNPAPPPPPGNVNQPPAGRGFNLNLTAIDTSGRAVRLEADCTIIGYAGGRVVMVDGRPYENEYRGLHTPARLEIKDFAQVTTIEFLCTAFGEPGDEFRCTVTSVSGRPVQFVGGLVIDRDVVAEEDRFATCSGTINART